MRARSGLGQFVASAHFPNAIAVFAVIIYVILRISLGQEIFDTIKNITGVNSDVMIPVLIIVVVYFANFTLIGVDYFSKKFLLKGLVYQDIELDWGIRKNGDFEGRYIYTLLNNSQKAIEALPWEKLLWFENPERPETTFRIIWKKGQRKHHFENDVPVIQKGQNLFDRLFSDNTFDFSWSPTIVPPLEKQESITYQVEIFTPRSEVAAFTPSGTHMGFPVNLPTKRVRLRCATPRGYKFVLMDVPVSVVDLDAQRNFPEFEAETALPEISADGTRLTWDIENLKIGYRYWVNYRIEQF